MKRERATDDARKPRHWKQLEIIELVTAFRNGGLSNATKVFGPEGEAKLEDLGELKLSAQDQGVIDEFVEFARKSATPSLFRRAALAALRPPSVLAAPPALEAVS